MNPRAVKATVTWTSVHVETVPGPMGFESQASPSTRRFTGEVLTDDPRYVTVENEGGRYFIPHDRVIEIFEPREIES